MVWQDKLARIGDYGCEAAKIAAIVVPYLQGRLLDVGSGPGKVFPLAIGIDPARDEGRPITDICGDGAKLDLFADNTFDAVFSSHFLEDIPPDLVSTVLAEWTRVLRPDGHLVLYVPSGNLYPLVGDEHANPDHKWNIYPGDIERILKADLADKLHGWRLILSEERDQADEYSLLIVLQKTRNAGQWVEDLWQRHPDGKQRALVIRYGAIGDSVVCASIFPHLKAQGYHVTVNTQPRIHEILRSDPNVDEWLIQATDFVPNQLLGPYWERLAERYDRIINLSESVETTLLTTTGKITHGYSDGARRRVLGTVNYLERTHDIADVPWDFSGSKFHPTDEEHDWAVNKKHRIGKGAPVIVWAVNGSSVHKVYPFTQVVISWLLEKSPCHVVLYGDPGIGRQLGDSIIAALKENGDDTSRVTNIAGQWNIRESLTFAIHANCVIGPETGPLNSVAMEDVPKVIYLSHSSQTNLTKHWKNTVTLTPDQARTPCYPCHRMHFDWSSCHKEEKTGAALCASNIKPEAIFKAVAIKLGAIDVSKK